PETCPNFPAAPNRPDTPPQCPRLRTKLHNNAQSAATHFSKKRPIYPVAHPVPACPYRTDSEDSANVKPPTHKTAQKRSIYPVAPPVPGRPYRTVGQDSANA